MSIKILFGTPPTKPKFKGGWMMIPSQVDFESSLLGKHKITKWTSVRANIRECFRLNKEFLK